MRQRRLGLSSFVAVAAACLALSAPAFAGDPATSIKVNEVESDGAADWIELVNVSGTATDVSGLILKDNDDARTLAIPGGTSIPPNGFLAVDTDVGGGFALDASDAARAFLPDGVTLIDGFTWTAHAITTFGRCPDGTGPFANTTVVSKGAANCQTPAAWPGGQTVTEVDATNLFGLDTSGLAYEGSGTTTPGVLWAVNNGTATLHRLLFNGTNWENDTANGWTSGKLLRYTAGTGRVDSEGVTFTDAGPAGGVYVSSERNLDAGATRRWSITRYDVSGGGTELTATNEWNLTADLTAGLPAPLPGANAGLESVEWVPDSYLVEAGFVDQATGARYNPATYPDHGTGIFFAGLEANGVIYAYALDQTGSAFTRVATIPSGFTTFAGLHWAPDTKQLWAMCDDHCENRHRVFQVDTSGGANDGRFVAVADYETVPGMETFNNEGFTITPASECVGGRKPVFWADDDDHDLHALRAGTIDCSPEPPPIARAGWSDAAVRADFDGDGLDDLAVGVRENGSQGAVHVFPGSALGITATGSQVWTQNSIGISDVAEDGDEFGRTLAVGDYDGDTFPDLAIGAPGENDGKGAVHVLYGSVNGLTAADSQQFSQASVGVGDNPENGDHFGAALAAGDVDPTFLSESELVVGVPDENLGSVADAGMVQVLQGTPSGLTGTGSQTWSQSSAGIADNAESGDRFGSSLAVGDLGGSAEPDVAIGVPEEDGTSTVDYGVVQVLLGSATGLTATGSSLWSQNSTGIGDSVEAGDGFGSSLAIGDVGGSAVGDLVVGVPGEDVGSARNAGVIQTIPGAAGGPTGTGSQTFGQGTVGIADNPELGDEFGYSVAVADFGGSTQADVAAGAPGESGTATIAYGAVHLIPGSAGGLTATSSQQWTQNSAGVGDSSESGDRFGAALAAADYGGPIGADLAIGVPGESLGTIPAAGVVQMLPSTATFLTGNGSRTLGQNSAGVADNAEAYDQLGISLGR